MQPISSSALIVTAPVSRLVNPYSVLYLILLMHEQVLRPLAVLNMIHRLLSGHAEFVKKLSGEEHDVKVWTWLSDPAMIAKRLSELQRIRHVRPKMLVAASITGLKDPWRVIGWLNSTTVGISGKEESIVWQQN